MTGMSITYLLPKISNDLGMKKEKWDIIESEYLIRRPWLTARRDKVRLPDGRINPEHYVLEYPDWVNVIAITEDGMFVMVEQYRHGLRDVYTELVAGVSEPGEDPLEAAKRELLEEAGYFDLCDLVDSASDYAGDCGSGTDD